MESSETQKKAIHLGNHLVTLLSNDEHADTFSRWVAHYIAEQMTLAESARGRDKASAEERCFKAILDLWAHRHSLPNGMRPLEEFEPILAALSRLDPDNPRPMYHSLPTPFSKDKEPSEVEKLIEYAIGLDQTVRILIDFVLGEATAKAKRPETKAMLKSAYPSSKAGDLDSILELIQRRETAEMEENSTAKALNRKMERVEKLEAFASLSAHIAQGLRGEVESAKSSATNESGDKRRKAKAGAKRPKTK